MSTFTTKVFTFACMLALGFVLAIVFFYADLLIGFPDWISTPVVFLGIPVWLLVSLSAVFED